MDDLQKDVGSKMHRMELNPLRDFINTKLKNLQDKFKTLTALKKEHEAAGTKSKYLRLEEIPNVSDISIMVISFQKCQLYFVRQGCCYA